MATATKSNGLKKILTAVCGVVLIVIVVALILALVQKDGFVVEGEEVRYYENGEMQIGWKIINDERYYFDPDGTMHKGWLEVNGNKYYFRKGDLDKNGSDIGGTLMINSKANITVDGELRYFEFDEYGKVIVDVPVAD
ncbi:MAG: hypothetical protein IJY04_04260 [Clostridia bacterium]|nr:hypothetical protein [Clostridia bacterium]